MKLEKLGQKFRFKKAFKESKEKAAKEAEEEMKKKVEASICPQFGTQSK